MIPASMPSREVVLIEHGSKGIPAFPDSAHGKAAFGEGRRLQLR
jgi:hypothetical protein